MSIELKKNISVSDLAATLSLLSLKIAQLHSQIEGSLGKNFLLPKEKLMFTELYQLANINFVSDDPDLGKLYSGDEIKSLLSNT